MTARGELSDLIGHGVPVELVLFHLSVLWSRESGFASEKEDVVFAMSWISNHLSFATHCVLANLG